MIPFYQKIVAFVVAGVAATLVVYKIWFGTGGKKAIEGGELKEIKKELETKKKVEKERKEDVDEVKTEKSEKSKRMEKSEKSEKEKTKKDKKEKDEVKTGKSIRDEAKKSEKGDVKTCKSIKGAVSPPQVVAERSGSCTSADVSQQKSALTLLNELKENSARVKVETAQSTSETNVSPIPLDTPEKKTEDTNQAFIGRTESPPPLSITRDAPRSPAIALTTSDDLITHNAQHIPGSAECAPVATETSETSTTSTVPTATDVVTIASGAPLGSQIPKPAPSVSQPPKLESGTTSSRSQPSLSAVNSEIELTEGGTIRTKVMRIHQCFCRAMGRTKALEDDQSVFDPKVKLNLPPTEIHPISYSIYDPVSLIKPIKQKTSLAKEILTKPKREKTDYLTPFSPILNAVAYAHHHSLMIEDLVNNKDFFDF